MIKRKKVGLIPFQTTTVSRRQFKLRGRTLSFQGRPRLGTTQSSHGVVATSGGARHVLQRRKKRVGASHSLNDAVTANKRATKKH